MSSTKRLSRAERRNRRIRIGISIAAVVVLLLIAAILFFQNQVRKNFASNQQEILSAKVSTGSISTTVSDRGACKRRDHRCDDSGRRGNQKVYVEVGAPVKEGDILASVDASSVLSALSDTQNELDELDEQLADVSDKEVSSTIKTSMKAA